ncbi:MULTISPECIES: hypothetical protein [unclassified Streptomyces]|uniref:hypothetical protein n=1 Tax=unclassified Streptomyces TaxID=2593676 RepID=UPI00364A2EDC
MSLRLLAPAVCAVARGSGHDHDHVRRRVACDPADPAEPADPITDPVEACVRYGEREHPERDWTCVGGTFTLLTARSDGSLGPAEVRTVADPRAVSSGGNGARSSADLLAEPTAERVDDHHANSTETVVAFLDRKKYTIPFNFKVGLHHHSGRVDMRWSSAYPVSLTYNLRIRRDVAQWPDDTVYGYEDQLYGSSVPTKGGTSVSTAGSVQSDRATCYKTTTCNLKKGDT